MGNGKSVALKWRSPQATAGRHSVLQVGSEATAPYTIGVVIPRPVPLSEESWEAREPGPWTHRM